MNKKLRRFFAAFLCLVMVSAVIPADLAQAAAAKFTITLSKTEYFYTGSAFKPSVTVKYKTKKLKSGDYTVSYKNNKNAGNATVTVKGKGKYKNITASQKFRITQRFIADAAINMKNPNVAYTGKACKPAVSVVYKGKTLVKGTDYTLKYANNVNIGTASVTITGIGNFQGNAKLNFYISEGGGTGGGAGDSDAISVQKNSVSYKTAAPLSDSGKLQKGQRAANILSDFNASNGEKGMNHPNGIATDGTHFVVCDTWNNRVLVYNTLPSGNTKPDVVIGQKSFTSFGAGDGTDQLNWPVSAAFAGKKLIIADTHNDRLLVYNTVPTQNGVKADTVIKSMDGQNDLIWPWAVWSDGTKLIVTSTRSGKVAFWDDVNGAFAGKNADKVIDLKGTPRTIISDGNYVLIGDHNMNGGGNAGSHIWKKYPSNSSSKPDFTIDMQYGGTIIDGNLYGLSNDSNFYVYNGLIDSANEKYASTFGNIQGYMQAGDFNQLIYAGGKTYACFYNSSEIAIYKGKLTAENYSSPIGYLGTDKKTKSVSVDNGIYQNPIPATDGKSLVLADDYNRLLAVYKTIPDTDNVKADVVYEFASVDDYPIDVAVDSQGKMYVLTAESVLVWNKIPTGGETYAAKVKLDYNIGKQSSRLEVDDNNLYIYSEKDRKVFRLDKNAKSYSFKNALCSKTVENVRGMSCAQGYLILTDNYGGKVTILKTHDFSQVGEVYASSMGDHLNLPADAMLLPNGQFVVVDNDRMLVWNSMDEAISDRSFTNYFELGRLDHYSFSSRENGNAHVEMPQMKSDGSLFTPTNLAYADGHLWVGEFKFSSRLVRYDLK